MLLQPLFCLGLLLQTRLLAGVLLGLALPHQRRLSGLVVFGFLLSVQAFLIQSGIGQIGVQPLQLACASGPTLFGFQQVFLPFQVIQLGPVTESTALQTATHRKPLVTLGLDLELLTMQVLALLRNDLIGVGRRRLGGLGPHPDGHHPPTQQHGPVGWAHQVNPVSTVRRSKARNSADCISCSRDTVRGNSWARGPSV